MRDSAYATVCCAHLFCWCKRDGNSGSLNHSLSQIRLMRTVGLLRRRFGNWGSSWFLIFLRMIHESKHWDISEKVKIKAFDVDIWLVKNYNSVFSSASFFWTPFSYLRFSEREYELCISLSKSVVWPENKCGGGDICALIPGGAHQIYKVWKTNVPPTILENVYHNTLQLFTYSAGWSSLVENGEDE